MMARSLAAIVVLVSCGPTLAESLDADEARQFVAGKLFEFTCFDGSHGAGRIYRDGSVVGTIQIHGSGPVYSASLPAGTFKIKGENVCASLDGLPLEPCFDIDKTGNQSFRGSLSGMNWAYCDFTPTLSMTGNRLRRPSEPLSLNPRRY
jgi:hypothetical protein